MSDPPTNGFDRRTVMKAIGVSSFLGLPTVAGTAAGESTTVAPNTDEPTQMSNNASSGDQQMFRRIPAIDLPVIDAYHDCETVWFIHTSVSNKEMADRLTEMINYPTFHAPKLADIAEIDALADIYVFENGVDRSDAEPWGGGPFGYQIDILDSVPGEEGYTSLRHANTVSWEQEAEPEILRSIKELMTAKEAGRLTIKPTDVVVTAPVVSWPDDPFGEPLHMGVGLSDSMEQMMERMSRMMEQMDKQHGPES